MLIAFRADASVQSGLGHLRRCISVAQGLARVGAEALFLCRRSELDIASIVEPSGFALRWVEDAADQMEDANASIAALAGVTPGWVVVDDYGKDARWHQRVASALGCRMVAIDDLADRPLDVDLLIDHNLALPGEQGRRYAQVLLSERTQRLFGPRFAMLGPAFEALPTFEVRPSVLRIGVFLGGTDPTGHSATAVQACRKAGFTGTIEVVTTRGNPALEALRESVATTAQLLVDLPDLRDFNSRCDLVIGAGGGAAWERCAIGVPTLTLCLVDNQRAVVPALVGQGATQSTTDNSVDGIAKALEPLLDDADARSALSSRSRELVDGLGTQRIAIVMAATAGLTLISPTPDHARVMWGWRNHPATRTVSRQSAEIPFEDHLAWLQRTLASSDRHLWIAMAGTRPVGVIRFDELAEPGHAEVSLFLDPALHGLGLGSRLLAAGESQLRHLRPVTAIDAEVLSGNDASHALFLGAGYARVGTTRYVKSFPV